MRRLALVLACLWSGSAHGWEHLGHVWSTEDIPVEYVTSDDGVEPCAGLPPGICREEAAAAWQAWADVGLCDDFSGRDVGFEPAPAGDGIRFDDGLNSIGFDVDIEPGVLAYAATRTSEAEVSIDGEPYQRAVETDIAVGSWPWATQEESESPTCSGRYNLRETLMHEIGHLAGLDHSCDEGQSCGQAQRDAVMNWSASTCEFDGILEDDTAGLAALYGPSVSFQCGDTDDWKIVATAPLTLDCRITHATLPWDTASWRFGDGDLGQGEQVTHTWKDEGQYGVHVEVAGTHEACGSWRAERDRFGYLRLCEPPKVDLRVEQVGETEWELLNDTPLTVIGCVNTVQWTLYEGDRAKGTPVYEAVNWELTHTFPHAGPWTAVLQVGGEAGTSEAQVTFGGPSPLLECGCAQGSSHVGFSWLVGLALALVRGFSRRRNSSESATAPARPR